MSTIEYHVTRDEEPEEPEEPEGRRAPLGRRADLWRFPWSPCGPTEIPLDRREELRGCYEDATHWSSR